MSNALEEAGNIDSNQWPWASGLRPFLIYQTEGRDFVLSAPVLPTPIPGLVSLG